MRTTVTLDQDVERLLKEAMHRSRRSFKETLNHALRAALGRVPPQSDRPAFVLTARPLGLRAGIDPTSFNKLADELEADAFREQHTRVTGPVDHDRP
ncbi:MAG: CopG family transcriptional regulator [Vicinamibacterales bacterium]|nr:CopG family transcriptional regulator [Vicinamibacterales bacterium]